MRRLYPHTITIYNKYKEDGVEKWKRAVVVGALWKDHRSSRAAIGVPVSEDSITVNISREAAKEYRSPHEWAGEGYTLQKGDMMARGEHPQEIGRASELTNCVSCRVTAVDDCRRGSPADHIKVVGE